MLLFCKRLGSAPDKYGAFRSCSADLQCGNRCGTFFRFLSNSHLWTGNLYFFCRTARSATILHTSRQPSGRIVWFTTGYLEYILPNFIPDHNVIEELTVSFEISSEAPKFCDIWPSDITFSLNGVILGTWTSPGDYGDRRGKYNPSWWFPFLNQYGLLKKLTITPEGTFLDAEKLSDVSTGQLALTDQSVMKLRFSVLPGAEHPGGCTLFGAGFGDYNQHIRITIGYRPENI